jgi:hypothetical protein
MGLDLGREGSGKHTWLPGHTFIGPPLPRVSWGLDGLDLGQEGSEKHTWLPGHTVIGTTSPLTKGRERGYREAHYRKNVSHLLIQE